jgi:hypothetical protein
LNVDILTDVVPVSCSRIGFPDPIAVSIIANDTIEE